MSRNRRDWEQPDTGAGQARGVRPRAVIALTVLFTYFLMACQRTAPGLATDQLMGDLGLSASAVGLAAGLHFFVYTGLQVPMGLIMDRYGPRFLLIAGTFLAGGGLVLSGLAVREWMLYGSRLLAGIGDATIWVGLVLVFGRLYAPGAFARLVGLASMTGIGGFLAATVPFAASLEWLGWRTAFLTLGLLLASCGALLAAVLPREGRTSGARRTAGLRPARLLLNRQAWALFGCHFGIVGGYIGFLGSWAAPYGMEAFGLTRLEASRYMLASLTCALAAAPLIGWLAGKLRRRKAPYLLFHLAMLSGWSALALLHGRLSGEAYLLVMVVLGAAFGSNSLTFTLIRRAFPAPEAGTATGFANTGGFLSAVLLPALMGAALDAHAGGPGDLRSGFALGFLVPALFSAVGLLFLAAFREHPETSGARPEGDGNGSKHR